MGDEMKDKGLLRKARNSKATALLIRGGRVIDPSRGMDEVGDLLVAKGKIMQVGHTIALDSLPSDMLSQAKSIDATGLIVCPGFIDLHCHLREPGFEDKETIATGTEAAAAGGFATVCCMPNTNPPLDTRETVEWVKAKASSDAFVHVLPIGCITRGRKGKEVSPMAELADAGVIGFSDDGDAVPNSHVMRSAMEHSYELGLPIIEHCEDKELSKGGVINEGKVSARLKLKGIPAASEEIIVARDLALAKLTGARIHIAHVSTCGSAELIRHARERGVSVTAEVTPHHLTLTEEIGCANAKVKPPLCTENDIRCLLKGLKDGVIDAIATDHAPHTVAEKKCPIELAAFGISGFETALGCLMGLVHKGEMDLTTLISKLTCEPAKILGRDDDLGTLKTGSPANITIFDPVREWVVDSEQFVSKGKNTPLEGYRLKGKVMVTIVDGRIIMASRQTVLGRGNS